MTDIFVDDYDFLHALQKHLIERPSENQYKLYFLKEHDSKQTKFEYTSGDFKLDVLISNKTAGLALFGLLKINSDDNLNLFIKDSFTADIFNSENVIRTYKSEEKSVIMDIVKKLCKKEEIACTIFH
jgi:hypothetical protein